MDVGHQSEEGSDIMAKSNTAKGKLVRKFGENIFGNPKYDKLLNRKPYSPGSMDNLEEESCLTMVFNYKKSKK